MKTFEKGLVGKQVQLYNIDEGKLRLVAQGKMVKLEQYLYVLQSDDRGRCGYLKHDVFMIRQAPST